MKKTLLLTILSAFAITAQAQGQEDFMNSMGKMYVVVGVILIIFIGIIIYLTRLDKKLSKIEKTLEDE